MSQTKPKNFKCVNCGREQYTREKCYRCYSKVFADLNKSENYAMSLTEEELDIIKNWGFITSCERHLSEKEKELYFKITDM